MKLDFTLVPAKNSSSTLALLKPDIGPQSRPTARAAMMKYAPCSEPLRNAVCSACPGSANQVFTNKTNKKNKNNKTKKTTTKPKNTNTGAGSTLGRLPGEQN